MRTLTNRLIGGGGAPPVPQWRIVNAPALAFWYLMATDGLGRWVALGNLPNSGNTAVAAISTDNGESWSLGGTFPGGAGLTRLIYNAGLFIAVGLYGVWSTPNGTVWSPETLPYAPSPANGYGCALAQGGTAWLPYRTHIVTGPPWTANALPVAANWRDIAGLVTGLTVLFDDGGPGQTRAYRRNSGATFLTGDLLPGRAWRVTAGLSRALDGWPGWFFALPDNQALLWRSAQADLWDALALPAAIPLPVPACGPAGLVIAGRSQRSFHSGDAASFADIGAVPDPFFVNDLAVSGRRYIGAVYDKNGAAYQYQASKFLILDIP